MAKSANLKTIFAKLEEDGKMRVRTNTGSVAATFGSRIYKFPHSAAREIIANGCTASAKALELGMIDRMEIHVRMDYHERLLSITDNGIGISFKTFLKLRELGTSGNDDPSRPGQFGIGFFSTSKLSSVVFIDTYAVEDGQVHCYKVMAVDGSSFSYGGAGSRTAPGTTVSMTLYEDIDMTRLAHEIVKIARGCGARVTIEAEGFPVMDELGLLLQKPYEDGTRIIEHVPARAVVQGPVVGFKTDTYEFYGSLVPVRTTYRADEPLIEARLCGMPINLREGNDLPFGSWALDINNEVKIKPKADRESLTEEGNQEVISGIMDAAGELASAYDITGDIAEIAKADDMLKLRWAVCMMPNFVQGMPDRITMLTEDAFQTPGRPAVSLLDALVENRKIAYYPRNLENLHKVEEETGYLVLRAAEGCSRRAKKIAAELGVPSAKEMASGLGIPLTTHEARPKGGKTPKKRIDGPRYPPAFHTSQDVHMSWRHPRVRKRMSRAHVSEDATVIMADTVSLDDLLTYETRYFSGYYFAKNTPGFTGKNVHKYSEFVKSLGGKKLKTNKGMMSMREIAGQDEVVFARIDTGLKRFGIIAGYELPEEHDAWMARIPGVVITGSFNLFELVAFMNPELQAPSEGIRVPVLMEVTTG